MTSSACTPSLPGVLEKFPLNLGLGHWIWSDVEHFWGRRSTRASMEDDLLADLVKLSTTGCDLAI
jgi:hypothetical protein